MDFSCALLEIKAGHRVAREGWNGKGMHVAMTFPVALNPVRRPYIYMRPADGELVPWVASQTDLLADDWEVVEAPAATKAP